MSFVVAIDGPAGTGKGTVTEQLSKRLKLLNIDTGATYRCVTLAMLKQNVKLEDIESEYISLISYNILFNLF